MGQDETALAEAVGRLTEEVAQLKGKLIQKDFDLREEKNKRRWEEFGITVWQAAMWLGFVWAFAGPLGYLIWSALQSTDAVTHCQVVARRDYPNGPIIDGFQLTGVVEWGEDKILGAFPRLQDATWAAKELNCPLRPVGK